MPDSENSLLAAALAYAAMGLPVFPCAPRTKIPRTEHGFLDATTDEATIRGWWTRWPLANIGMPTGKPAGCFAVDIDPAKGGDESIERLESEHGRLPDTTESHTGGGGRHKLFGHPGGYVKCSESELAPGVDIKGDGGYIVLPPSIHPSGKPYVWELSSDIANVRPVAAPAWLLDLVRQPAEGTPPGPTGAAVGDPGGNPIPEGQRNGTLARLAGTMRNAGMGRDEILAGLRAVNASRCRPPLDDREVERIAGSIARYRPDAINVALIEDQYGQMFGPQADPTTIATCLANVEPTTVRWLWPGRFACGKLSLLAGQPGLGKSFLTLDIAARVSRGDPWPCEDEPPVREPANVVLLSAEDDLADTIRPRLDAAGADVRRVHAITTVRQGTDLSGKPILAPFRITEHMPILEKAVEQIGGCLLIIIDPISSYLGQTDSHNNSEVREALVPLAALAAKTGAAIIAVTHLNKGQHASAINQIIGSIAFVAAARAAYSVCRDEEDPARRLVLPVKNNLGVDETGFAYRLLGEPMPRVEWEAALVSMTADQAISARAVAHGPQPEALGDAADWLLDFLAAGPRVAQDVFNRGKANGHTRNTLKRAKAVLKVQSVKQGLAGGWMWVLPGGGPVMMVGQT